ncbi:N-acyl-D-amino-acid deacylase family protein [Isoptericola hypogeus]|uniref:N-acyl-D-amino-acid deacylase family protein n=1 Tax=Isoptericola hypogeus TaxID=300179 RepID=UPI003CD06362
MDWLVRDALVVDGTGAPGFVADVGVTAGRITAVDPGRRDVRAAGAHRTVDAAGRALTPGFIDLHAHSDVQILANPDHTAKVGQGVTLEVLGQDGLSLAPVDERTRDALRTQLAGWNGDPPGFAYDWDSVAGYLDRLDRGIACHAAYLVPQGTLRLLVVGPDDRPATPAEQARMADLLARGLREGALGMSSGLTYPPSMYADDAELAALLRVVAAHGGYYSPHTRSYGEGALEAYAEVLDLARATGCPLHLTHATMNFAPNAGRAGELLALVDAALDDGVDVTLDSYPYLPGSTTLSALLPSWAFSGGPDAALARLADPADRARIVHELEHVGTDGCHGCVADWDTIEVSGVQRPGLEDRVGRTIAAIARGEGRAPGDVFVDLLRADRLGTTILQHVGHEENVRAIMTHRAHCGGSDGILVGGRPHPRAWGTFPRYLARYVRELGLLTLEDCVHHLTGRPAARLRLAARGLVRPGYAADLVLLDPATIRDVATFDDPRRQAEGIDLVLVDGVAVLDDGARTSALPGRAVRRSADGAAR